MNLFKWDEFLSHSNWSVLFDKSWDFIFRRKKPINAGKFKIRSVSGQTMLSRMLPCCQSNSFLEYPKQLKWTNERTKSNRLDVYRNLSKAGSGRARQKKEHPVCDHWNLIFSSRVYHIECNMLASSMFNMTNDICLIEPTKHDPNSDPWNENYTYACLPAYDIWFLFALAILAAL